MSDEQLNDLLQRWAAVRIKSSSKANRAKRLRGISKMEAIPAAEREPFILRAQRLTDLLTESLERKRTTDFAIERWRKSQ